MRWETWVGAGNHGESSLGARERRRDRNFGRWSGDAKRRSARKYPRTTPKYANRWKFPKPDAKLLEGSFFMFCHNLKDGKCLWGTLGDALRHILSPRRRPISLARIRNVTC
jgi:hypothetical protein